MFPILRALCVASAVQWKRRVARMENGEKKAHLQQVQLALMRALTQTKSRNKIVLQWNSTCYDSSKGRSRKNKEKKRKKNSFNLSKQRPLFLIVCFFCAYFFLFLFFFKIEFNLIRSNFFLLFSLLLLVVVFSLAGHKVSSTQHTQREKEKKKHFGWETISVCVRCM